MRSTVSNADIITIHYKEYLLNAVFFKLNCDISLFILCTSVIAPSQYAICIALQNLYCRILYCTPESVLHCRICIVNWVNIFILIKNIPCRLLYCGAQLFHNKAKTYFTLDPLNPLWMICVDRVSVEAFYLSIWTCGSPFCSMGWPKLMQYSCSELWMTLRKNSSCQGSHVGKAISVWT